MFHKATRQNDVYAIGLKGSQDFRKDWGGDQGTWSVRRMFDYSRTAGQ